MRCRLSYLFSLLAWVYPHTSREAGENCSCLSNPLVDLCVDGQVVGDGGAEVRKVIEGVEFVVVDGND